MVAAPRTTIDLETASGGAIEVEQRKANEMLVVTGPRVVGFVEGKQVVDDQAAATVSTAARGTEVWNPAFDVTPAVFIDAIVTEVGVVEKLNGEFNMSSVFEARGAELLGQTDEVIEAARQLSTNSPS